MWVEKTRNGLRLCDRYKGFDGKLHRVSVPLDRDTAQARRKAQEELQKIIADKSSFMEDIALNRLVELYLDRDIKESTKANYRNAFAQICDILGNITAGSLTAPYALRKLSESKKPHSCLNRYIMLLNSLMEWAYQFGYVQNRLHITPFRDKEKKRDTSLEYLEASELSEVLEQLQGSMAYYLCKFLALTGCRIGEAAALTWEDIGDRYISITKAYKEENGISTPKTAHSVRDIYIQPELRQLLKEYREWRNIDLMARGIRTDLLFYTQKGNPYTASALQGILKRRKSPKHLHPHIFRHTHTALLAEQGMSLEAIARRLGHSDSNITRKIYFHITEKLKERDEQMLDKVNIL